MAHRTLNFSGEKIQLGTPDLEYEFYDETTNPEGGYNFDVVLKSKPATNIFSFDIETDNLDFFYQPPLNEETQKPNVVSCTESQCSDQDGKVIKSRPENVVGSYAVYHKTMAGNYSLMGGKNYQTGKAFHIFRPKILDSAGHWVWGNYMLTPWPRN